MVVVRRAAVDDDVGDSALRRQQGKRGRRIDGQRRTERDDQVGPRRRLLRPFEDLRIEALPETDRRRFQESAAIAQRRFAIHPKEFEMRLRIAAPIYSSGIPPADSCRAIPPADQGSSRPGRGGRRCSALRPPAPCPPFPEPQSRDGLHSARHRDSHPSPPACNPNARSAPPPTS